ncbi:Bromodomain-containing protein, partial [Syncephalis plumigaleata]
FHEPVDTTLVTDYLTVIREPMDLTTMRNKVQQQVYTTLDEFRSDIKLICDNARIYNKPDTIYYREASRL